ncbi:Fic family protein [Listeria costaricensis]|uniref:Fic family protein n=1 Tax=Listeria costaricensis TaxID=2026604 RepID=UPI0013C480E5|nr:Fic family protein [Listeria costaricensis]
MQQRKSSYGTYETDLEMTPIANGSFSTEKVTLFLVNTPELQNLLIQAMENSKAIELQSKKLPGPALQQYLDALLINELQSTNEIEGVRSTKKEIAEALEELNKKGKPSKSAKRFLGLVKLYQHVDNYNEIRNVQQIRAIYDELVADEVEEEDVLDGDIFRKKFVGVQKNGEFTHKGVEPESRIIDYLNRLIQFLQTSEMPELYRYMVIHYYFEYIHPFYDGNGRTGRYLVCSLIKKKLDPFSAITFSYIINRHKNPYYKAFEEASHPLNKGEITFFCKQMLEFLVEGQFMILEDMEEKRNKLDRMHAGIKTLAKEDPELTKADCGILFILTQSWLFSRKNNQITNAQLIEMKIYGARGKITKSTKKMADKGYLVKVSDRPSRYTLDENFAETLLNEYPLA